MSDYQSDKHSFPKTGPLIRLWGIRTNQLPPVPGAEGTDGSVDKLTQFLASLLKEAVPFIDSVALKRDGDSHTSTQASTSAQKRKISNWKPKGTKSYHPESTANVDLFERVVGPRELEEAATTMENWKVSTEAGETWICRRSVHDDKKEKGTASWDEFRDCFKERHAETEDMFTPSVVKMEKKVVWDCSGVPPQKAPTPTETYSNFTLCILESRHRIGKPLKDRTFPILQMTCSVVTPGGEELPEFLVISVTIPDYFTSCKQSDTKTNDTVVASYASIERIRKIPSTTTTPSKESPTENYNGQNIEWLMALTSNAGGILPQWVQNLAVPGQIAKDVPLFLGWIVKEREKVSVDNYLRVN